MDERTRLKVVRAFAPLFEKRVAKGAAWLDKVDPGWELKVDVNTLNMGSGQHCMLGQVFMEQATDYASGWAWAIGVGHKTELRAGNAAVEYGFNLEDEDYSLFRKVSDDHETELLWSLLAEEWVFTIKDRLDKGVAL